jgi:uncharacterized protein
MTASSIPAVMFNRLRTMFTHDREGATDILTSTRLGTKQSLTPEGFLLCEEVPIKRTGEMLYGPGETPIKPGPDGYARVTRDARALFTDAAITSYNGKPVVNDHPPEDVTPHNWKQYAVGTCLNARRGTGDDNDIMVADLLITDHAAIRDVQAGKREVSAGYEADYEQTGDGAGRQTNIIGNHIALVDRGRCGPRCAIGDHQPTNSLKENQMGLQTKSRRKIADTVAAAIRKTFLDAGEATLEQLGNSGLPEGDGMGGDDMDDEGDGHTHIHIHSGGAPAAPAAAGPAGEGVPTQDDPVEARFQAIESTLAQIMQLLQGGGEGEAPPAAPAAEGGEPPEEPPTEDSAGPLNTMPSGVPDGPGGDDTPNDDGSPQRMGTGDSAALHTSYQALVSDAEILLPGYRFATFDAKLPRQATVDSMCMQRRRILDSLYSTHEGKALIDGVSGVSVLDLSKQTCPRVAMLFRTAAGAKRLMNNRSATGDAHRPGAVISAEQGGRLSLSAVNAQNRQFWQSRAKKQ